MIALLAVVTSGCVRTQHRDGVAAAPITDVYAVDGVVTRGDLVGTPIAEARVAVLDGEDVIATGVSDVRGRFTVSAFRKSDAPPQWVQSAGPAASVAYRYHQHWRAQLVIEAAGFEPKKLAVDVPRPITAEPVAVSLRRQ